MTGWTFGNKVNIVYRRFYFFTELFFIFPQTLKLSYESTSFSLFYYASFYSLLLTNDMILNSSRLTVGGAYNVGIFHWRPTEAAKKLAKEWKAMLLADDRVWDQNGFNELVRRQLGPSVDGDSELVYAYDGSLKLGILPASIFCSGHTYFVQVQSKLFY